MFRRLCPHLPVLWLVMRAALLAVAASASLGVAAADPSVRLVFGSFANATNAQTFASQVGQQLATPVDVIPVELAEAARLTDTALRYRVIGPALSATDAVELAAEAQQAGLQSWRWLDAPAPVAGLPQAVAVSTPAAALGTTVSTPVAALNTSAAALSTPAASLSAPAATLNVPAAALTVTIAPKPSARGAARRRNDVWQTDFDIAVQNRLFAQSSGNNRDQAQQSVSGVVDVSREFRGGSDLLALSLFGRVDSDDKHRSHWDVREFNWTHVANSWELQAGIGQVFWGVVEFNHLIDIVNQTDFVEDIDTEDKLGPAAGRNQGAARLGNT